MLVASGLTAALVVVPGIASAAPDGPENPLAGVTDALTGTENPLATGTGGDADTGTEGTPGAAEDAPPFEVPDELKDAFRQAGFSEACVEGVSGGVEQLGAGLAGLADFEAFAAELQAQLAALGELDPASLPGALEDLLTGLAEAPPGPSEDIVGGLEAILAALEECVPAPPGGETPTPTPTPTTPPAAVPSHQPPAHTPMGQAPQAQPVAYLGYAPTGADAPSAADSTVPLTALAGGLVLLTGAGAAGYGMRRRAVRTRD